MGGGGGGGGLGAGSWEGDEAGGAYLDHAGACLADPGLPAALAARLAAAAGPAGWRGNPHSGPDGGGDAGASSSDEEGGDAGAGGGGGAALARLRRETLALLRADPRDYCCVLTSGATAALRLVAESFPFGRPGARLCFPLESHTSVLGLRPLAEGQGARCDVVRVAFSASSGEAGGGWRLDHEEPGGVALPGAQGPSETCAWGGGGRARGGAEGAESEEALGPGLFCSPAECNFSGGRLHPSLGATARSGALPGLPECERWWWLLDAAKACGSGCPPNLAMNPADFVALSFYKIFGWPTGLGALVLRKEALALLLEHRGGFGGGAVAAVLPASGAFRRRPGVAGLEDGTPAFLEAEGALEGFSLLRRMGGPPAVEAHCAALGARLRRGLASLRLPSGEPACELYGPPGLLRSIRGGKGAAAGGDAPWRPRAPDESGYCGVGAVATFNLRRPGGAWVGYSEVARACARGGFRVRTGCMCNPGACMRALGLSEADLARNAAAGKVCGDDQDLLGGRPTGAVRASLGFYNTGVEVDAFLAFLQTSFCAGHAAPPQAVTAGAREARLERLFLYPVKSCRPVEVEAPTAWPLDHGGGLLHDRRWAVVDAGGCALSQKGCPALAGVQPSLEPEGRTLTLRLEGPAGADLPPLTVDIGAESPASADGAPGEEGVDVRVCGRQELGRAGWRCPSADVWLSSALGMPCRLVEVLQRAGASEGGRLGSFANRSPLLVLSEASLAVLNERLKDSATGADWRNFRPNILLSGCAAFLEDACAVLSAGPGGATLLREGPCLRCSVVTLDPETGAKGPADILRKVALLRRELRGPGALPSFGSYFTATGRALSPGTPLQATAAAAPPAP